MNTPVMHKGTWLILAVFSVATLFAGPAHVLLDDHGEEVVFHCDGHGPLSHLEGSEGGPDLSPCDLCLTLSPHLFGEARVVGSLLSGSGKPVSAFERSPHSCALVILPLLRAPPSMIL